MPNSSSKKDVKLPYKLNSDILAKTFIKFISNRYPSGDQLLKLAPALGIEHDIQAQIIIFSQYRDAIRQTSPRLYSSQQHREDLYMAILEGLEELEAILDQEDEIEEDELYLRHNLEDDREDKINQ